MLRHWDDTFSNVVSGRPGTSVPIFVSMDHASYADRLMNPLSMATDIHVFAKHTDGTVVRAFKSLGWVLAWLSIKNKHELGFRAEDRTNSVVFNKYTGGNHFEPTWLDGDNDNDDDNEAAAHSSDNIMDTST